MRGQPVVFDDFRAGVNLLGAPYSLDRVQGRDCRNVTTNNLGALSKRRGFQTLAAPILHPHSLAVCNASPDIFICISDDGSNVRMESVTLGGTSTDITPGMTLTAGVRWSFIQAPTSNAGTEGPIYMLNGTDSPLQWDGTGAGVPNIWTASTSGTVPNGKYLCYFNNRVFVAGESANPSRLYWSGIGDAGDWASPSGGYTTFDPDDGEPITGLGVVGDYILVFKPRKIYVVFDTDTGGYRRISSEVGCLANRSIVETSSGTFFLSNDRQLMVTDGGSIQSVSNDIDPLLQDISGDTIANAAAVYWKGSYYLSISGSDENNLIIEFDTRFSSWWLHDIQITSTTTVGVNDWAIANPTTTSDLYTVAANTTGSPLLLQAFVDDIYKDNGNAYTSYWITQWHSFGLPHVRKILRQLRADARGDFIVEFTKSFATTYDSMEDLLWEVADSADSEIFGGSGTFGGSGIFGGEILVQEHRYYTPGTARAFSIKFSSDSNGPWDLYSYTMAIDPRRD
jgi:hypothetical protein